MAFFIVVLLTLFRHLMDIMNLLPSPRKLMRTAISLFNSVAFVLPYRLGQHDRLSTTDFEIDDETGFLPRKPPPRLQGPYRVWEEALREAPDVLSLGEDDSETSLERRCSGEIWRTKVESLPILDTRYLETDRRLLQRGHLVLAWLVNFYVHSMPPVDEAIRVPRSLAMPLLDVSRVLGIAPILTFADTVLWNWESINPDLPVTAENMRFVHTFSGSDDERNFFLTAAKVELKGVEMLRIIDHYHSLPDVTDLTSIMRISKDLGRLASIIDDMKDILQSVRGACDPHTFYWDVRPWLEGSDSKGEGWTYDGVGDSSKLDLSGPSGGQSSTLHALDIFLDVDHRLRHRRMPAPSENNQTADRGFMERMKRYMPGTHREYLSRLAKTPCPIRDLALKTPALREPYNLAVMALKHLRDLHMRIACLYIVTMSRSTSIPPGCPVRATLKRLEANRGSRRGPARGTGGNEVSTLLKAGRDATMRTLLPDP